MRLTFWRRARGPSEATLARIRAEEELARVKAETPGYAALGERFRKRREENHLVQLFRDSIRGSNN